MKEEYCIILDYLPTGYADRRKGEPIAQAVGTSFYTLLEVVPREGIDLKPGQEVYIGDGKREEIRFIRGAIEYRDMTNASRSLLEQTVEMLVKRNEQRIVEFFNKAGMITPRMHQFQLLPGIGKKHLLDILEARSKKPFESFADMTQRVKLFPDPIKTFVKRVMQELQEDEKYYLFVQKHQRKVYT
jgi:putative nucleotide binding protein